MNWIISSVNIESKYICYIYDVHCIYNISKFIKTSKKTFQSINPFKNGFYHTNKIIKIALSLINAFNIIKIFYFHHIDIIFSATPSIFIRIAKSLLRNNVKHISYLRSAYPIIDQSWSDSEKLEKVFKKFNIPLTSFINPYNADLFLVSGKANKNLLISKNFPKNRIKIIGPAKLTSLKFSSKSNFGRLKENETITIIYATQAFIHHKDDIGHNSQLICLESMIKASSLSNYKINFVIRIHPRDKIIYYKNILKKYKSYISYDNCITEVFLKTVSDQRVLVSSTSTLLFEWGYLGGKSYSIGTDDFIKKYCKFFNNVHINPFSDAKTALDNILRSKEYISKDSIDKIMAYSRNTEKLMDIFKRI